MKAKYQKYYDNLRGKDFASSSSSYSSALSTANSKLSAAESTINSSAWIEKGLEIIKGSVLPSLKNQSTQLESGISALSQVAGKVSELVSQVEELKSLEEELTDFEEKLNNLGGKWTYVEGGSKSQTEVNSHNKQIEDLSGKISDYKTKIEEQEAIIDGTAAAINGISFNFTSSKSSFAGSIAKIREAASELNNNQSDLEKTSLDDKDETKTVSDGYQAVSKVTQTGSSIVYSDGKTKYSIPKDPVIAAKKAEFIGDYDDPNNYTHFTGTKSQMKSRKNKLELFDNTTGEVIDYLGEINMKVGEKRIITVKLPSDTGKINRITRTSAYTKGKDILSVKSDIDPDPDNVDYVLIAEAAKGATHAPSDTTLLQNNCYDWIIEAVAPGRTSATQTTLWESEDSGTYNLKAMSEIFVNVIPSEEASDDEKEEKKNG